MHSNHLGTLTVSSKLLSSNKTLTVRIWSQFVYISKQGIDEQEVRQYFANMLCTYINAYTYKQYMLIAGYEYISCSRIVQGTLLQDSYSDLVQAQLDSLLETRALSRFRVRFSSMQQQTHQHIIKLEQFFVSSYGGKYGGIVQLSVRFFVITSPKGQKLIAYPKRVPKGAFLFARFVTNPPSRYPSY